MQGNYKNKILCWSDLIEKTFRVSINKDHASKLLWIGVCFSHHPPNLGLNDSIRCLIDPLLPKIRKHPGVLQLSAFADDWIIACQGLLVRVCFHFSAYARSFVLLKLHLAKKLMNLSQVLFPRGSSVTLKPSVV